MTQATAPTFGKWRNFFWPIHNFELKKFLPMFFLFFFINFNYTILRDTKDTLIVTAPGSGAEALPFLKVWGVLPFAFLFMLAYFKLSNVFSREKVFISVISFFTAYFALFALVLYPYHEALHPTAFADWLQSALPKGLGGLVAIIRNWTYSTFYIMAELWGSVAISLLFWGFANDTTRVSESKRFYALFGIGAQLAMFPSGELIKYFSKMRMTTAPGVDAWGVTLNYTLATVVVACLIVMGIYMWINRNVLTDARFFDASEVKKSKTKLKMSIGESLKYLVRSPYILALACIVLSYGIAINLVEVSWKGQLKLQYTSSNDYQYFMGSFSQITAAVTMIMLLFVSNNVIRAFGWRIAALITPVVLLLTGLGFFSSILFNDALSGVVAMLGTTPLMLAVLFGTAQNVMSKSSKYSLFDPTKEMAYIPLDPESKLKGKAAIDVVGARFGKAGGSFIQQGLLVMFGSLSAITPYVAGILFLIIGAWIVAANSLARRFEVLNAQREAAAALEANAKSAKPAPALATNA